MASVHPGWMPISQAVRKYRISYWRLREMVQRDIFTRGRFHLGEVKPRIYLRVDELEAWKTGGIEAVEALRSAMPTHDLGGEGGV